MYIRHRIKINLSVNARETVEILILAPAACCPLKHLGCQLVFPTFHIISEFKFGRGKRILAVSHKLSIQPQGNSALCALEGNEKTFSFHLLRHFEIFHIACHWIEMLRDFSRMDVFMAFPWVLHVGILGSVVAFHLNVCRYADIIPVPAGILFLFKALYCTFIVAGIMEFPDAVQAVAKRSLLQRSFLWIGVTDVVGMGIHSSVLKIFRILY